MDLTSFTKCVPVWLRSTRTAFDNEHCFHCLAEFTSSNDEENKGLFFMCHKELDKVHHLTVPFCKKSSCASKYCETLEKQNRTAYMKLLDFYSLSFPDEFAKLHRRTGDVCECCGILEEIHSRFKWCSGCKYVKYCGEGCQKTHWNKHKPFCKMKIAGKVNQKDFEALYERVSVDDSDANMEDVTNRTKSCTCFPPYEKRLFAASEKYLEVFDFESLEFPSKFPCSRFGCKERIGTLLGLTFHGIKCSLPIEKREVHEHVLPTLYCCGKCRNRSRKEALNMKDGRHRRLFQHNDR